jgi:hypothetical protein
MQTNSTTASPARRGLFARIDQWFERRQQRAIEAYLATSQNVAEVETRMRNLDRRAQYPYY